MMGGWWIGMLGSIPGALGIFVRQRAYPRLFASCGKDAIFGQHLVIRHPERIHLGNRVVLGDRVVLDAAGNEGAGIVIGDDVFVGIGTHIQIWGGTVDIHAGSNIGSFCEISTRGETRIGKDVLLAAFCKIVAGEQSGDTVYGPLEEPREGRAGKVEIGQGCWLGVRVRVLDGTRVEHDAIVGAHALVNDDIPPLGVAVGIPAKVIRTRT